MVAFTYRMPAGIPGNVDRAEHALVEPEQIMAGSAPASYGLPVVLDATAHTIRGFATGDAATAMFGVAVRPYPTQVATQTPALGDTSIPSTAVMIGVLKRGYINVKLNNSGVNNCVKGGLVYIRVANPSGGADANRPIGGFEAVADGANTVVLPNSSYWMGPSDSTGNTELAFNL